MKKINPKDGNKVLSVIQNYKGRKNPILARDISQLITLSDREIRKIVQYLINVRGHPIGSTTKGPYGFFMIIDFEDYFEAVSNLSNRKEKIYERIKALRKACQKHGIDVPKIEEIKSEGQTVFNITNSVIINLSQ